MNTTYLMPGRRAVQAEGRGLLPPVVPCRGPMEAQLEELKERLLQPLIQAVVSTGLAREIRWAATEAAALAWYTACPILVLPSLLEEKIGGALQRWDKQQQIRARQSMRRALAA
jgi:hypothetical protein